MSSDRTRSVKVEIRMAIRWRLARDQCRENRSQGLLDVAIGRWIIEVLEERIWCQIASSEDRSRKHSSTLARQWLNSVWLPLYRTVSAGESKVGGKFLEMALSARLQRNHWLLSSSPFFQPPAGRSYVLYYIITIFEVVFTSTKNRSDRIRRCGWNQIASRNGDYIDLFGRRLAASREVGANGYQGRCVWEKEAAVGKICAALKWVVTKKRAGNSSASMVVGVTIAALASECINWTTGPRLIHVQVRFRGSDQRATTLVDHNGSSSQGIGSQTRTGDENASGLFDNVYSIVFEIARTTEGSYRDKLNCLLASIRGLQSVHQRGEEARSESQAPEAEVALWCDIYSQAFDVVALAAEDDIHGEMAITLFTAIQKLGRYSDMPVVIRTQVLETHAHMMITWHPWCTTSGVTASKDCQGRESTRAELELDHNTPTMTSVFAMWTIDLTIRSSASTPAVGGSIVRPDSGEERHVQVESVYKLASRTTTSGGGGGDVVEGAQAIRKGGAVGVQGWDLQIEVSLRIVLAGKGGRPSSLPKRKSDGRRSATASPLLSWSPSSRSLVVLPE
ncbi:hypothetical protein DFH08DRAFT_932370 [Mycena albidolilacea]|uniref:Uncharacterized protein n=1 Tax=Mycena albidolilacea TaxID=1033008 RepID=A0AAD7EYF7_9AGAR|nr:hypothetical protein DFH08DRAFT_932370 [Mycena albidolilacea]